VIAIHSFVSNYVLGPNVGLNLNLLVLFDGDVNFVSTAVERA
jgi:hypothetical protein